MNNDPESRRSQEFNVDCAATLIAPNFAITAHHCFCEGALKSGFRVTISGETRKVIATHFPDSYCKFNCKKQSPNKCDMAIIELDTPVITKPIKVYNGTDEVGKTITFVGWGVTGTANNITSRKCDNG